ncbi:unnamed protein product [Chironomus riparius]|uniref:Invertebrate defensins family profile domain-containing protein n=1 Tax=Chironomus riparius TaxID=315576 RepID=A0A9N9S5Q5_9DIPT|nr:unnamed protein product [Chironomus riparius]
MRTTVLITAFLAFFALAFANPIDQFDTVVEGDEANDRAARVTCDIFMSNPLCAIHCIAKGYKGGYCNNKLICICRN